MTFSQWIYSLPVKEYTLVRNEIKATCKISNVALKNWINGNNTPLPVYRDKINAITKKYGNVEFF